MEIIIRNIYGEETLNQLTKDGKVTIIDEKDSSIIFNEIDADLIEYQLELSQKEKDSEVEAANIVLTY